MRFEQTRLGAICGKYFYIFDVDFILFSVLFQHCIIENSFFLIIFLGAKIEDGKLLYLMKFDDTNRFERVSNDLVKKYWPEKLIQFFEEKFKWVDNDRNEAIERNVRRRHMTRGVAQTDYTLCKVRIEHNVEADRLALSKRGGKRINRSVSTCVRSILKSTAKRSTFFGRRPSQSCSVRFADTQISLIDLSSDNVTNTPAARETPNIIPVPSANAMNIPTAATTNQSCNSADQSLMDEFDPLKTSSTVVQTDSSVGERSGRNAVIAGILSLYQQPRTSRPVPGLIPINRAEKKATTENQLSYPGQGLLSYDVYTRAVQTLENTTSTSMQSDYSVNGLRGFLANDISSVKTDPNHKSETVESNGKSKHSRNDCGLFDFWANDINPVEVDTCDNKPIQMNTIVENFGVIQYDTDIIGSNWDARKLDSDEDFGVLQYDSDSD